MTTREEPASKEAAGRWLREERRRHGYETAGALARALGVDPSRVSNYERGQSYVPDDRATQIAKLFQMDEIAVRRHLGLWVPPDEPASRPATTRQDEAPADEPQVSGWGGRVIDLPPVVKAELSDRDVLDYKIVDLTRPGSDHRLVVLWTGDLPEDLDEARAQLEDWTRRMRAVERVLGDEDDPDIGEQR